MGTFKINGELELNSYLTAATTLYISSAADKSIIFRHGTTEYARINPSGCLNINSTQDSDAYKLWVAGTAVLQTSIPRVSGSYNFGSTSLIWKNIYAYKYNIYDSTNKYEAGALYTVESTSTTSQPSYLILGNDTNTGTAGSRYGYLRLFSTGTGYANLRATAGTTTTSTHYLPTTGGTLVNSATFTSYISVSNNWEDGTTEGPTLSTTVSEITGTAVAIPVASTSKSGVVTVGNQRFRGVKTLEYPAISSNNTRYQGHYYKNGAGTTVGDHWYDTGDPTKITTGKYYWRQYSPNSTADTATTGFHETFSLPAVTVGLTANKTYEIFTSKSYSTLDSHYDERYVNVSGDTMTGGLTTTGVTISATAAAKHLQFSRENANYIAAPTSGYFCFLTNGVGTGIANADLIISTGQVYPGTNDAVSLGTSSKRWTNIYCTDSITISGTTDAIMDATTTNPRIIFAESGSQPVSLVYTDYNSYRSPAGLKVLGTGTDASPAWFEVEGNIYGAKVYGAVWNDYAEFRNQNEYIEPGYCVTSSKNGKVYKTTKRLQYCEGIVSDTFGFSIGETEKCKTPLAVSGRVLAFYNGDIDNYNIGDVVCAGANGKIEKMTRDEIQRYPDRIVGTISEIPSYDTWGDGNVPTAGRIWIKIK